MQQDTQDNSQELEVLVARKDATLRALEIQNLKDTAKLCLHNQICRLSNLSDGAGNLETLTQRLTAWRRKTGAVISENVHPTEGQRFRELFKPSNLADEVHAYFDFLETLEKELANKSIRLDELLEDRLRLGHVVLSRIPLLNTKFLKVAEPTVLALLENVKYACNKTLPVSPPLSLEAKTVNAFLSWESEVLGDHPKPAISDHFKSGQR